MRVGHRQVSFKKARLKAGLFSFNLPLTYGQTQSTRYARGAGSRQVLIKQKSPAGFRWGFFVALREGSEPGNGLLPSSSVTKPPGAFWHIVAKRRLPRRGGLQDVGHKVGQTHFVHGASSGDEIHPCISPCGRPVGRLNSIQSN